MTIGIGGLPSSVVWNAPAPNEPDPLQNLRSQADNPSAPPLSLEDRMTTAVQTVYSALQNRRESHAIIRHFMEEDDLPQLFSQHRWDHIERCVRANARRMDAFPERLIYIFQEIYRNALQYNPLYATLKQWERSPPKDATRRELKESIAYARFLLEKSADPLEFLLRDPSNPFFLPSVKSWLKRLGPVMQSLHQLIEQSRSCSDEEARQMQDLVESSPQEFRKLHKQLPKLLEEAQRQRPLLNEAIPLEKDLVKLQDTLEGVQTSGSATEKQGRLGGDSNDSDPWIMHHWLT